MVPCVPLWSAARPATGSRPSRRARRWQHCQHCPRCRQSAARRAHPSTHVSTAPNWRPFRRRVGLGRVQLLDSVGAFCHRALMPVRGASARARATKGLVTRNSCRPCVQVKCIDRSHCARRCRPGHRVRRREKKPPTRFEPTPHTMGGDFQSKPPPAKKPRLDTEPATTTGHFVGEARGEGGDGGGETGGAVGNAVLGEAQPLAFERSAARSHGAAARVSGLRRSLPPLLAVHGPVASDSHGVPGGGVAWSLVLFSRLFIRIRCNVIASQGAGV